MSFVQVNDLRKVYKGGFEALKGVSLEIEQGEILALLGPMALGNHPDFNALRDHHAFIRVGVCGRA